MLTVEDRDEIRRLRRAEGDLFSPRDIVSTTAFVARRLACPIRTSALPEYGWRTIGAVSARSARLTRSVLRQQIRDICSPPDVRHMGGKLGGGGPWPLTFDATCGLGCGAADDHAPPTGGQFDGQGGLGHEHRARAGACTAVLPFAGSHPAAPVVQMLVRTDAGVGRVP